LDFGGKWNVPIDLLKSFGSLEDVLAMIEEGDQGAPLRERVKAIREDEKTMKRLGKEWAKRRSIDYGFCTDDEDADEDEDEDDEDMTDDAWWLYNNYE
jgi:hypothetical protein